MIPVALRPEPPDFDKQVRQKGYAWLRKKKIALSSAPPKGLKLPNYWSKCNEQLWEAYSGVCAYLSIYFSYCLGATADHFIAKSGKAGDAYEWSNFRLACWGANNRKNRFDDVLDPIGLPRHTFVLNLASGLIMPNPSLSGANRDAARKTIDRLQLDSPRNNEMRAKHFYRYQNKDWSLKCLREESPFVYEEVMRQGLK
jgi:uncharacterized protein (TIGR02646 family)